MKQTVSIFLALNLCITTVRSSYGQDHPYDVIYDIPLDLRPRWVDVADNRYLLARHLAKYSHEYLDKRTEEVRLLRTQNDWRQRQTRIKQIVLDTLGPWPERTPLKSQIVGTLQRENYRIEKLIFQSMRGFYVTAAIYVPNDLDGTHPGVLYLPGHARNSFRSEGSQQVIVNLVHQGFVVLAVDPLDQAERIQHIDPAIGKPFERPGRFDVHMYPAGPCFLAGISIARYFIWDYMRALDYLISRPEVDGDRIGVCGNSGGGNMTVFLSALDDRVTAAVSSCWVTSHRRMLSARGGGKDAEQDIFHSYVHGIEYTDWLLLRAPKPILLLTKLNDFFPIQGTRETIEETEHIYDLFGAKEYFAFSEDFGGHGYTKKNREALYAFFHNHLRHPGTSTEQEYPLITNEEQSLLASSASESDLWVGNRTKSELDRLLTVTRTGQVVTEFKDAETVFTVNARASRLLLNRIDESRKDPVRHLKRVKKQAAWLTGYHPPPVDKDDVILRGAYQGDGFQLEKYLVIGTNYNSFSFLVWIPENPKARHAILYVDAAGKKINAATTGEFETLSRDGHLVVALEPMGRGETEQDTGRWGPARYNYYFQTAFCRRSHVGIWADNIVRTIHHMQNKWPHASEGICCVGRGEMGPAVLHAALFDPDVTTVVLLNSLATYESIVENGLYSWEPFCFVPGALKAYDLPDLIAAIAPRRVLVVSPLDHLKQPVGRDQLSRSMSFPMSVYSMQHAKESLALIPNVDGVRGLKNLLTH